MDYPKVNNNLPFADYTALCRQMVKDRRQDLHHYPHLTETIIDANSPFEQRVAQQDKKKIGVLMTHGLLDSPFTFHEISAYLHQQGFLTRALLLPGHGTRPDDLINVSYHDWLHVVRYGIESLRKEVDDIFLIGYSTGACLSLYHALHDNNLAGLILLAPALKLRAPVDIGAQLYHISNRFTKNRDWVLHNEENDYVKYRSIAFNGVKQVVKLAEAIRDIRKERMPTQPMYMILTREDETISSEEALDYFSKTDHQGSRLLLYTGKKMPVSDARIEIRDSKNRAMNIANYSHPSLAFSTSNPHYGELGDFINASHVKNGEYLYGAYNNIELNICEFMFKYGLLDQQRRILTYNPDFQYMVESIAAFIRSHT